MVGLRELDLYDAQSGFQVPQATLARLRVRVGECRFGWDALDLCARVWVGGVGGWRGRLLALARPWVQVRGMRRLVSSAEHEKT